MALGANLSLRIMALIVTGFVLLQVVLFAATGFSGTDGGEGRADLPSPATLSAMARAVEQAPPAARTALLAAFNGSLYTVHLAQAFPAPTPRAAEQGELEQLYRARLTGRTVRVNSQARLFGGWGGPRRAWILPLITVAVDLKSGGVMVVDNRLSPDVRGFLNRRARRGILGGLVVLAALALAVRQTTRPLSRLARNIRTFALEHNARPLPVEGSREMRDLAQAYNEMQDRIAGLIAERTRILAAVAHDMRTYLTRLRLRIEFIADEGQRDRAASDLGEMSALLDDTLLFAAGGDRQMPLETIDLADELNRIAAVRREMDEPVMLLGADAGLPVRANRLAVRRILANLIDNGLRHGGQVEIAAAAMPDGIAVEVRDDGPGVPPEALSRLGMPFQRLDPSRDRQTGGAGLGLAIVRALAARQGATIAFANRVPRGFAVRIVFPPLADS